MPYSQIVTMATQITCAPGWFPANLRRRDEAELIVALLEAQLHRSRVCGKRGAPELLEVYGERARRPLPRPALPCPGMLCPPCLVAWVVCRPLRRSHRAPRQRLPRDAPALPRPARALTHTPTPTRPRPRSSSPATRRRLLRHPLPHPPRQGQVRQAVWLLLGRAQRGLPQRAGGCGARAWVGKRAGLGRAWLPRQAGRPCPLPHSSSSHPLTTPALPPPSCHPAQGVVTFRCRGSKSRPTTVGIIADGEMVESFW